MKSCVSEESIKFFKSENYPRGTGNEPAKARLQFKDSLKDATAEALSKCCQLRWPIANKLRKEKAELSKARKTAYKEKSGTVTDLGEFASLVEHSKHELPDVHVPKEAPNERKSLDGMYGFTIKKRNNK